MKSTFFLTALLVATLLQFNDAKGPCKKHEVDFIMLEGDATILAIEDDIRADLEKVGFVVKKRVLQKKEFNEEMVAVNFNFAFSKLGARRMIILVCKIWLQPMKHIMPLKGLPEPNTKQVLNQKIDDVQVGAQSPAKVGEILNILHASTTGTFFRQTHPSSNKYETVHYDWSSAFDYVHSLRVQRLKKYQLLRSNGTI